MLQLWHTPSNTAMIPRTRKAFWAMVHQTAVIMALLLFPLALATAQIGVPAGSIMKRFISQTENAYENASCKLSQEA